MPLSHNFCPVQKVNPSRRISSFNIQICSNYCPKFSAIIRPLHQFSFTTLPHQMAKRCSNPSSMNSYWRKSTIRRQTIQMLKKRRRGAKRKLLWQPRPSFPVWSQALQFRPWPTKLLTTSKPYCPPSPMSTCDTHVRAQIRARKQNWAQNMLNNFQLWPIWWCFSVRLQFNNNKRKRGSHCSRVSINTTCWMISFVRFGLYRFVNFK